MDIRSTIRLQHRSDGVRDGWWAWSMWVEGPSASLDEIDSVRYILHHTFRDPVRIVRDRASQFALNSSGWGEFAVHAHVTTKAGDSIALERWLTLASVDQSSESADGTIAQLPSDLQRRPRVFISHSATDTPTVHSLQRELRHQGIDVVSPDTLPAGMSWQEGIQGFIDSADIVAIVTSGELRQFAKSEVSVAEKLGKPVISIVLGTGTPPPQLESRQALRLESDDGIGAIADALGARAKDHYFADE